MAKIIFNDSTDYDQVYDITKLIYGDVAAKNACCCDAAINNAVCRTAAMLYAADIADGLSETERYDHAVKAAYLAIYPFADKDYNP